MVDNIYAWMESRPADPVNSVGTEDTILLHAAIETQTDIGWENFFRGRVSPLWAQCRHTNLPVTPQQWTSRLITWIWHTVLEAWNSRNKLIFGETLNESHNVLRLRLAAKIQDLYRDCAQLPTHLQSQHITKPYDELMKSHPDYLTIWITQAESTLRSHRKAITNGFHNTLTRYFPRRSPRRS
jgi:hypothetical protein